jgi:hypothetical protein
VTWITYELTLRSDVHVLVCRQTFEAEFCAHPAVLDATERRNRIRDVAIDADRPGFTRFATPRARSVSVLQTVPPRPKSESLAIAMGVVIVVIR